MAPYNYRPENALKKATELIDVGKKNVALEALHDVITSRRNRTWQKPLEAILLKFLELCVEMRSAKRAKDGLHQYKNMCQAVSLNSLEVVIRRFISLSEAEAEKARSKADETLKETMDVDDLDAVETPESLILSAVSVEDTKDRTDRAVLTPWLKFLWEAYRTVLEILRNNVKLEVLYQDTAKQAFQFCLKYQRKTEFRRLCDILRNHLQIMGKYPNQQNAVTLTNPDSLQLHLETRFEQLNVAMELELWQEAFRSIDDIHGLMSLSKKTIKGPLMASYYTKLVKFFHKSENHLFHAMAWHKLYTLHREQKKTLTVEEHRTIASNVVLATISIPLTPRRTETEDTLQADEAVQDKKRRLAALLFLNAVPTRESLIEEMLSKNLLAIVQPELKALYEQVELKFHPLSFAKDVQPILDVIEKNEHIAHFSVPVKNIVAVRTLQQLSQVYQTMRLGHLFTLVPYLPRVAIEKLIVDNVNCGTLAIRICHRSQSISFGTDVFIADREITSGPRLQMLEAERMRNQVTRVSERLHKVVSLIHPERNLEHRARKKQALAAVLKALPEEHRAVLGRKQVIETRKEFIETLNLLREKEQMERKAQQKAAERKAEQERLEEEARRREEDRRAKELEEVQRLQALEKIEMMKKTAIGAKALEGINVEDLKELDADEILQKQVEQIDKEKRELQAKLRNVERKVDHIERAKRLEEIPLLREEYEKSKVEDREWWVRQQAIYLEKHRQQHHADLEIKGRLHRMKPDADAFLAKVRARLEKEYQKRKAEHDAFVQEELAKRKKERRIRKQREAEERRQREERERQEREEAERAAREEEERKERQRIERERKEQEYQEQKARLDEQERLRRQREAEIEARERKEREEHEAARRRPEEPNEWRRGERAEGRERDGQPREEWRSERRGEEGAWRQERGGERSDRPDPWRPSGARGEADRDREAPRHRGEERRGGEERRPEARGNEWRGREEPPQRDWRAAEGGERQPWRAAPRDGAPREGGEDRWRAGPRDGAGREGGEERWRPAAREAPREAEGGERAWRPAAREGREATEDRPWRAAPRDGPPREAAREGQREGAREGPREVHREGPAEGQWRRDGPPRDEDRGAWGRRDAAPAEDRWRRDRTEERGPARDDRRDAPREERREWRDAPRDSPAAAGGWRQREEQRDERGPRRDGPPPRGEGEWRSRENVSRADRETAWRKEPTSAAPREEPRAQPQASPQRDAGQPAEDDQWETVPQRSGRKGDKK